MLNYLLKDILNAVILFVLGLYVFYKNPRNKANLLFMLFCLSIAYWDFVDFNIVTAETFGRANFWASLYLPGTLLGPSLLLHLVLFFTERKVVKQKWLYVALYLPPLLIFIFDIFTGLVAGTPMRREDYWELAWNDSPYHKYGYYVVGISQFLTYFFTFFVTAQFFFKTKDALKKKQVQYILWGFLFGLLIEIFNYAIDIFHLPFPHIFGLTMVSIFIAYGMLRFEIFSINAITAAETIVETMNDILFLLSPDGIIRGINNATSRLLGFGEEELQEKDIRSVFSKTDFANKVFVEDKFKELFEKGKIADEESILKTKQGEDIPVSISGALIKSKQNDIRGIVCIARDITERKYAEEEIKRYHEKVVRATSDVEEEKARMQATLFAIGEGIIVTDKGGRIVMVNKAFEEILGWKSHEVVGKKSYVVIPMVDKVGRPITKDERLKPLRLYPGKTITSFKKTYTATTEEHFFISKDKKKIKVRLTTTPIIFRWDVVGQVEVFHPVDERK